MIINQFVCNLLKGILISSKLYIFIDDCKIDLMNNTCIYLIIVYIILVFKNKTKY